MIKSVKTADYTEAQLQALAMEFRITVLDMLHSVGSGHWGGSASVAELLTVLYFDQMKINPSEPKAVDRDRLVLSKGHAAPMLYTVLARRGFYPESELKTFRKINSRLQGHPCMNKLPGIDMSTGALGHGISVGLGMSLVAAAAESPFETYVIVGEGCLNEGSSWEAIMAAGKFKPKNLTLMIDYNKVQLDGYSQDIMPLDPLGEKFTSFNWNVADKVYDGHSVKDIRESLAWAKQQTAGPKVIIYNTCKGKGVGSMEDSNKWHGAPVDDETYAIARPELEATLKKWKEIDEN